MDFSTADGSFRLPLLALEPLSALEVRVAPALRNTPRRCAAPSAPAACVSARAWVSSARARAGLTAVAPRPRARRPRCHAARGKLPHILAHKLYTC